MTIESLLKFNRLTGVAKARCSSYQEGRIECKSCTGKIWEKVMERVLKSFQHTQSEYRELGRHSSAGRGGDASPR
jgi:hypothetical protein